MSPEQVVDTIECGNAQENWQTVIRMWRTRAIQSRSEATRLLADSLDAQERAAEFDEDARNFDAIAKALENAPVTFPASVDTHAERGDVQQAPSLMGSAVPEGQTPE